MLEAPLINHEEGLRAAGRHQAGILLISSLDMR